MKTFSLKREQIEKNWILIDATDAVLGRLAVISANILRGKNKTTYTPNQDCGDNLIIINSDKIALTGKKASDKIYYKHTGYPGGIKETTPEKLFKKKPGEALKLAVKRMLPGGPLAKKQRPNGLSENPTESTHSFPSVLSSPRETEFRLIHKLCKQYEPENSLAAGTSKPPSLSFNKLLA